jgi:hypothetical protein
MSNSRVDATDRFSEIVKQPARGSTDYDSVAIKKIDANTIITINKKGGTVVRMLRTVVSKDGKTSTSDQVGYIARGGAFHNVTVFDKQ